MPESGGDAGSVHVPPGRGKSVWFNGGLVTFYALGEDTGGAFTLFEEAVAPQDRALPHLHHEEDQAFYVLEGKLEFYCDDRTFTADVGSFVYVPRGTTHSYENLGTEPGRLLILSTPAGGTERIFFELGEPAAEGSPPSPTETLDLQSFRATVQKYGSDIDLFALLQQISAERSDEQHALGPLA
jgi:mannose-6-phosphate isomerase-like protein (cupin superfamily)